MQVLQAYFMFLVISVSLSVHLGLFVCLQSAYSMGTVLFTDPLSADPEA